MKKIVTDIYNKKHYTEENVFLVETNEDVEWNVILIHTEKVKQKWLGMGGAVTQAVAVNFDFLPDDKKEAFVEDYFDKTGLGYNMVRLPIASCDFAPYSYQYTNQTDLSDFSIDDDRKLLIPLLNSIQDKKEICFLASSWSPPAMYKDNDSLYSGALLKKYYQNYSEYLIKYLNEYKENGIPISYISIQNEPFARQRWESCHWSLKEQEDFIYNYFLPQLHKDNIDTKILLWDHNKDHIYDNIKQIYKKDSSIGGVAFHWYVGHHFQNLQLLNQEYPELLLFETELCCGFSLYSEKKWVRDAELYLYEIIGNINNGMNAFIDWNILLDQNGGPNHKNNMCKSPIILNKRKNDYIKTPIYYYLKHLANVPKDSSVILNSTYRDDLKVVSFLSKENEVFVIILNVTNENMEYCLEINGKLLKDNINSHSIVSFIFSSEEIEN